MRPDGIAFPANNIMITVGIKLYSSVVGFSVCQDNLFTTDARLFFIGKTGIETDSLKRKAWVNEQTRNPITFCLRLHFVFPNPVNQFVLPPNSKNEVHVLVTLANCEAIFSKPTCDLLKFICEPWISIPEEYLPRRLKWSGCEVGLGRRFVTRWRLIIGD